MKKLFTLLLAVATSIGTMFAEKVQIGDLYYNLDATNQTAEVTYQFSLDINNYIGLTSANIPASVTYNSVSYSVTSIGGRAFFLCTDLTSVTIPNSVTSIGDQAFCAGLTSVTIPNSVTSIGENAFGWCSGLTSIDVASDNSNYCSVDGVLFNKDKTTLIQYPGGKQGAYTIPNSVTSIGNSAFFRCSSLTSVTIPNSVTSIGEGAFNQCTGLTSVTIPNSVTSIGKSAFSGCSGLTSVTIPNSVTRIVDYAFSNCTGLTSVTIESDAIVSKAYTYDTNLKNIFGDQVKEYIIGNSVTSIGDYAFYGCSGLTSVTIPNSVTSIGNSAFSNCYRLTSVTIESDAIVSKAYTYDTNLKNIFGYQVKEYIIGNSVTSIGNGAFYDCSGLTSVTIGNSVTSIGNQAFAGCSGLTSITIPGSVTSIGWSAFAYCTGLTSVNITDIAAWCNITFSTIDSNPLYYAKHLYVNNVEVTNLVIPNSVTSIGGGAFAGCSSLTSVTIPGSVTSIGNYAFAYCTDLTSVTIPNSVTSIGQGAFVLCAGLTSVTIPNSVTSIGEGAFVRCTGLTSIDVASDNSNYCSVDGVLFNKDKTTLIQYPGGKQGAYTIPNSVTSIGIYAFSSCTDLTSVTIPGSVTSIGGWAFYECTGLNSVTIPNSVTSIGERAFAGCSSLTSVTCFATTPPQLDIYVFEEVDKSIPLYVPAESIEAYQAANKWKYFMNILPISQQGLDEISQETKAKSQKLIRNGQIFILRGEKTYTLQGQVVK